MGCLLNMRFRQVFLADIISYLQCMFITYRLFFVGVNNKCHKSGFRGVMSSGCACSCMVSPSWNIVTPYSSPSFSEGLFSYSPRHCKWLRLSARMLSLPFMCWKVMWDEIEKISKAKFFVNTFFLLFLMSFWSGAWPDWMTTSASWR